LSVRLYLTLHVIDAASDYE